jgi:hypothetical protein
VIVESLAILDSGSLIENDANPVDRNRMPQYVSVLNLQSPIVNQQRINHPQSQIGQ